MSVKVTIYGTDYPVRGEADSDYIHEVAEYVDGKMKEVADTLSVKSTTKVAILAALNITDELFRLRGSSDTEIGDIEERLTLLADRVREGLSTG